MLPAAAISVSISQASDSPFHTLCFQKVVTKTPPRKLKITLCIFSCLTAPSPLAIAERVARCVPLAIPGSWCEQRWGMGLPTATPWWLCGPQHSHTLIPRGLSCLLGVAGKDRSDLQTEIRCQCKGQL